MRCDNCSNRQLLDSVTLASEVPSGYHAVDDAETIDLCPSCAGELVAAWNELVEMFARGKAKVA